MRQVTTRRTQADQLVLVGDQIKKVGEEVEDKPDVLELFHPDLPPVTVTVGQTPATARRSMTVTTTIGWSSDDKMVKTQVMIRRLLVTFGNLTLVI